MSTAAPRQSDDAPRLSGGMNFRLRVLGGPRLQRRLERAKEYSEILGTSCDRVTIEPCSPLCRRARVRDLLKCGGAKGIRTPALTRQDTDLPAVSLRLVPIRSRSLPAVLFSGLDGVKTSRQPFRFLPKGPCPSADHPVAHGRSGHRHSLGSPRLTGPSQPLFASCPIDRRRDSNPIQLHAKEPLTL